MGFVGFLEKEFLTHRPTSFGFPSILPPSTHFYSRSSHAHRTKETSQDWRGLHTGEGKNPLPTPRLLKGHVTLRKGRRSLSTQTAGTGVHLDRRVKPRTVYFFRQDGPSQRRSDYKLGLSSLKKRDRCKKNLRYYPLLRFLLVRSSLFYKYKGDLSFHPVKLLCHIVVHHVFGSDLLSRHYGSFTILVGPRGTPVRFQTSVLVDERKVREVGVPYTNHSYRVYVSNTYIVSGV